jgi:hypothetical protein
MRHFHLPDGLPSGQFLPPASPSLWQSDAPVAEPVQLWARCQQREEVTSLRPVLAGYPIYPWPASDPAEIAAFGLEAELEASWRSYRELQLSGQLMPANLPADVEPWEPDPGPPYEQWPGLAPAVGTADTIDPDEVPRLVLADLLAGPRGLGEPYLVLVPAARSADIPAVMGWDADVPACSCRPCCAAGRTGSGHGSSPSTARGSMCRLPVLRAPRHTRRTSPWSTS